MLDYSRLPDRSVEGDVRYATYPSIAGELYLIGDESLLLGIEFCPASIDLKTKPKQGFTGPIRAAFSFLDSLFHAPDLEGTRDFEPATISTNSRTCLIMKQSGIELRLDMTPFTPKERSVYLELLRVPRGSVISYGALARKAGLPGAARFVGSTMAKNHFPLIIPCHRVIKADGSAGYYSSGPHRKKILLDLEKSTVRTSLKS